MVLKDSYEYLAHDLAIRRFNNGRGTKRLLCFPPAGGPSTFFKRLADNLSEEWTIWAVDPPGHGLAKGKPMEKVNVMADYYFKKLQIFFDGDFYLLGYSLGGVVVYQLTSILETIGISPKAVIICGTIPPHIKKGRPEFSLMSDDELLEFLIEKDGIPREIADYRGFLNLYLPAIRADLRAFDTYSIQPESKSISARTWIFGGIDDNFAKSDYLKEWNVYCRNIENRFIPGGHFFINTHTFQFITEFERLLRGDNDSI